MTLISEQHTEHGRLMAFKGTQAAQRVATDVARYYKSSSATGFAASRGKGTATIETVGALASIVGALAGVSGSKRPPISGREIVDLDLIDISSYPAVLWQADNERCLLREAPRPLISSERTSLSIVGQYKDKEAHFEDGTSKMILSFAIGVQEVMSVVGTFAFLSGRWGFDKFEIDGLSVSGLMNMDSEQEDPMEELIAVTFLAETEGYPSFSLYSHEIRCQTGGSTYLAFCDAID